MFPYVFFLVFFVSAHSEQSLYWLPALETVLGYSESASICMMIRVIIGEVTPVSRCDSLTESLAKKTLSHVRLAV